MSQELLNALERLRVANRHLRDGDPLRERTFHYYRLADENWAKGRTWEDELGDYTDVDQAIRTPLQDVLAALKDVWRLSLDLKNARLTAEVTTILGERLYVVTPLSNSVYERLNRIKLGDAPANGSEVECQGTFQPIDDQLLEEAISCVSDSSPLPHDDAMLGISTLMTSLGIPREKYDAVRGRLARFRKGQIDGWQEGTEPKPNEPRYLYRLAAVRDLLKNL